MGVGLYIKLGIGLAILLLIIFFEYKVYKAGKKEGFDEGMDESNQKVTSAEKHLASNLNNNDPNAGAGVLHRPRDKKDASS